MRQRQHMKGGEMMEAVKYTSYYSKNGFWNKLLHCAKKAGWQVIEKALWLYYAAEKPETPVWAKATIYAALGYLICPVDAIPDMTPVIGYVDDLGVLTAAVASVSLYIDDHVKVLTARKMGHWFGG